MNMDSHNPLGIVTTPEATSIERRKSGAMMASVGLFAVKPTGLLGLIGFIRRLSKGVLGKIAMGVFCTAIYQSIMNFPAFWHGIKVLCAFVGLMGDAKVTRTVRDMLGKGGSVIAQQPRLVGDADEEKPKPTLQQRAREGFSKAKNATKRVAHDTGEAVAKKAKPIEKDARKAVDEIKERLGPPQHQMPSGAWTPPPRPPYVAPDTGGIGMGGMPPQPILPSRPSGFGQSVRDGFKNVGNQIGQYGLARQREQQAQLEKEAPMREEFGPWWAEHGANGSCGRCSGPLRVSQSGKGDARCSRCGIRTPASKALLYPPPMPDRLPPAYIIEWKKRHPEAMR